MSIRHLLKKTVTDLQAKKGFSFGLGMPHTAEQHGIGDVAGWIPSGITMLDRSLGGGLPLGRISELFSENESEGKAQPLSSQVLTPTGFVPIGDIKVRDLVIGSSGTPVKVIGVYNQGSKEVFLVSTSDGGHTKCCADHLWSTQTVYERAHRRWSVKKTSEIQESLRCGRGKRTGELNHLLPPAPVVEFASGTLPLHPYLLGALLGDGSFRNATLVITNVEKDILDKVASVLPSGDCGSLFFNHNVGAMRIKKRQRGKIPSTTRKIIQQFGLYQLKSERKFIPTTYLFSSVSDRLQLLRGLLDTDGHVMRSGSCVEFCSVSKRLAEDVTFLARSLGAVVSCSSRIPTYNLQGVKKRGNLAYRLRIKFSNDVVPVSSEKHLRVWRQRKCAHQTGRKIKGITTLGKQECVCIRVDSSDGLYITDDFIVTHNSTLIQQFMVNTQKNCGVVVLLDSESATDRDRAARMGLDLSTAIVFGPQTVEDGFLFIDNLIHNISEDSDLRGAPILIVWDTINAAPTRGEKASDPFADGMVVKPRIIAAALRNYVGEFYKYKVHMCLVNQSITNIDRGNPYAPKTMTPGGKGIKFYSTVRIRCKKTGFIGEARNLEATSQRLGISVKVEAVKNKLALPYRASELYLYGETGYDDVMSMANFFLNGKVKDMLDQKGGRYYLPNGKCPYWKELRAEVLADPKLLESWRARIEELIPVPPNRDKDPKTGWYMKKEGCVVEEAEETEETPE